MGKTTKEKIKILIKEKGYKVRELSPCDKNNTWRIIVFNYPMCFYILGWKHRRGYANLYEITKYSQKNGVAYDNLSVETLKDVYDYLEGKL